MTLERRYESSGGLVTERQPFLSVETAQALLDKINGFPCIQEILVESGKNYRRSVYFSRATGQLTLYSERNGVWTDMSIYSKSPNHQVHLLFPLHLSRINR